MIVRTVRKSDLGHLASEEDAKEMRPGKNEKEPTIRSALRLFPPAHPSSYLMIVPSTVWQEILFSLKL